ncbi:MAG TPA: hypothetical protein VMW52_13465 [Phycisphaerae bacterium]|nr:hypothetical protein [Phycisphaerae bacterium]
MPDRQVGTIAFDTLRGRPDRPSEALEVDVRDGVDYATVYRIGKRSAETELTAEILVATADRDDTVSDIKALAGTVVSIYDAHGTLHKKCAILDVQVDTQTVRTPTAKNLVTARFRVMQGDPT